MNKNNLLSTEIREDFCLGLDLGTNSVGWALLDESNKKIVASGARIFEAGTEGDIASGKDQSRNAARREKRMSRRLLMRRAQRLGHVFSCLQKFKLMPANEGKDSEARHRILNGLDAELLSENVAQSDPRQAHLLPYLLRAKALDEKIEPYALGRAFYHLAQRRGFLSNRRSQPKENEKPGEIKQAIETLGGEIKKSGVRTLGEYFSKLDPEKTRIRSRWTSRQMYLDEFEAIWTAQAKHHSELLTAEAKKAIHKAIFYQRPLKSQKGKIGFCELEKKRRRAPWACLEAQRFRMLQRVNDLLIISEEGEIGLSAEERQKLISALETQGDLKFSQIKKELGLPKTTHFNLQDGGEEKLPGNRLASKIKKIIGKKWDDLSPQDKNQMVLDLWGIQSDDRLAKRAQKHWGLEEGQAREFAKIGLEDGYCALSKKAIRKILPLLEEGKSYMTARMEAYPGSSQTQDPQSELPQVSPIRNPIVERSLTQMRKVVNALIRQHGKPGVIRVELARDLKKSRKQRMEIVKNNRDRQKEREEAAKIALKKAGISTPRRSDIEKVLLAEECGRICPYTGNSIGWDSLFGPNPQFDIEHIIPFSRSLDDSFMNKTLCYHEENRNVKKDKTPFEAYSQNGRWEEILTRVKNFNKNSKHPATREKLRRFKMDGDEVLEMFKNFDSRQLNDTRYASKEAARYLGLLYGCREDQPGVDALGKRRIQASAGQVTAWLRNEWELNKILDDGGEKTREDHRHHAVDAIVTALAKPGIVKALSEAASRAAAARRKRFGALEKPWASLAEDAREAVSKIIVSHAVRHRVSGALHDETFYSPPKKDAEGKTFTSVKKSLDKMKPGDVEKIVDGAVKKAVMDKLKELGQNDPSKAFINGADISQLPALKTKDGQTIPIRGAKIQISATPTPVGKGNRLRYVQTASNHHLEVFEVKDKNGKTYWDGKVVTLLEATNRLRQKLAVIQRNHGEGAKFLFTLANGDIIEYEEEKGKKELFRTRTVSMTKPDGGCPIIHCVRLADARDGKAIKAGGAFFQRRLKRLQESGCRKVQVDPLGRVFASNE